jgi:hypothetical protein
MHASAEEKPLWNPYIAGFFLGLVLLASFLVMGWGLGASGAGNRFAAWLTHLLAPEHAEGLATWAAYFSSSGGPLKDSLVFGVVGTFLGGLVGSLTGGRYRIAIGRGPNISVPWRLVLALAGGTIMGFAARLGRGCTSGQALTGGAELALGSWVFMFAVFGGAYAFAWFVRRQWL